MDSCNSYRVDHNKARELVLPECNRILFVLTVADLAEDRRESLIQQAVKVLGWAIDGSEWNRALEDAIQFWEEEADDQ